MQHTLVLVLRKASKGHNIDERGVVMPNYYCTLDPQIDLILSNITQALEWSGLKLNCCLTASEAIEQD